MLFAVTLFTDVTLDGLGRLAATGVGSDNESLDVSAVQLKCGLRGVCYLWRGVTCCRGKVMAVRGCKVAVGLGKTLVVGLFRFTGSILGFVLFLLGVKYVRQCFWSGTCFFGVYN
jgi:hypothetical protein